MVFDSVPGVALTETAPKDIGTAKSVGTGTTSARWDHVHDTAAGFIDTPDKFVSGVVNTTALKAGAVTDAKIATATITSGKLAFGTWEKIVETTVTGTAVTTISITGLDLDAAKAYLLLLRFTNPTTSDTGYAMYLNADTTGTNYWRQYMWASGTSIAGNRVNDATFSSASAGEESIVWAVMARDPAGYVKVLTNTALRDPSAVWILFQGWTWTTTANVTQIDITASVTGAIGIGSRVIIFKVSK